MQKEDKLRRLSKSHARLKETAQEATARAQAAEALVHPTPHIAGCDSSARPSPAVWGAARPAAAGGGPGQATPTLPSLARGRRELLTALFLTCLSGDDSTGCAAPG